MLLTPIDIKSVLIPKAKLWANIVKALLLKLVSEAVGEGALPLMELGWESR